MSIDQEGLRQRAVRLLQGITPGPWRSEWDDSAICAGASMTLARIYWSEGRTEAENRANAEAIAALPTLVTGLLLALDKAEQAQAELHRNYDYRAGKWQEVIDANVARAEAAEAKLSQAERERDEARKALRRMMGGMQALRRSSTDDARRRNGDWYCAGCDKWLSRFAMHACPGRPRKCGG